MELVRFCVYCGNEVKGQVCHHCQEYDGIVDGYISEDGDYREFERAVCSECNSIGDCVEYQGKLICVECLQEKGEI